MGKEKPLWKPSQKTIEEANVTHFARQAIRNWKLDFNTWPAFYRWSVEHPEQFWPSLWRFAGIRTSHQGSKVLVHGDRMPGAKWFPDAKLNFAENLLRRRDNSPAIIFWGEDKLRRSISHAQLHDEVSRMVQALRSLGVKAGDRIAGYLPNVPEAVIAMLASSSIGAIWSTCSPDFGVQGVLDRFGQIEPVVLFAADGYYYNGKTIDTLEKLSEITAKLPSVKKVVVVPYVSQHPDASTVFEAVLWNEFVAGFAPGDIRFAQLPFNHPLYILYSSGTTGAPKCIVHGAGGTLLQHLKEHLLHVDIHRGDRLFYFTTLGWMMWNWLVSGLASGATLILYDGSPSLRGSNILFDLAQAERVTHFGTSAKFIESINKIGLSPRTTHDLSRLRVITSTGSPLAPEGFEYVYRNVKKDVCLSSMSGGTDLIACFANGIPILPVWPGELQCRALAMAVEVFDEKGRPVRGQKGELVCTRPFPSMPIGFWNDPDGEKFHAAYFEKFPSVWTHGDWCEITEHDGVIIYGRSDATLNPGGVRIGTAEIYRQVEQLDEVFESLVIGQTWPPGAIGDTRVVLFVRLRDGIKLDQALADRIRQKIRENASPRHVPAKIVQVDDIPRTRSNKIVEIAVRNVVHGEPVRNIEALANPEALEYFRNRAELRT
ncbi:MAG: acetoacetate--CoA ligase [Betaproteobacteria bacterium]|nr:acetoacetate--CoA ligase [Betaproteobacteria bacterium]